VKRKPAKIWFDFTDKSDYSIELVGNVEVVSLEGRNINSVSPAPNTKHYIMISLWLSNPDRGAKKPEGGFGYRNIFFGDEDKSDKLQPHQTIIVIDHENDKYAFVMNGKLAKWPCRYKISHEMRERINEKVGDKLYGEMNECQTDY
jgi:hypothetical protein